ncbi:MAG: FAD-binding oxidoreductase [Thermomicrobiales bacterium]|nr:FAD-binding oxidoreductase [Thermomicrobiales bacterium]
MSTAEVIVIGGGITGCATAYELSRRGAKVTVIEREAVHAMGSGWTLAGVRQSGRAAAELPIAREAVKRWATLADELRAELDYLRDGNLRLALMPEHEATIRKVVDDGNAAGVAMEYISDVQAVREIAPEVTDTIVGACFCPTDGHADNLKTVSAYAAAAQRLGTTFLTGVEVLNLITDDDRVTGVATSNGVYNADTVVVAAGIYSPRLLEPLGLKLPLTVVHCPVAQTIPTTDFRLAPVLGVATGAFAARQTAGGGIRFIGASIPWTLGQHSSANVGMTVQQMDNMTRNAIAVLPRLAELRIERVWGGLIDDTPDNIPVLDAVASHPGLVVGAGFSGHGFGIGPMSGEILANLVLDGRDDRFDLEPFRIQRFIDGVEESSLEMLG